MVKVLALWVKYIRWYSLSETAQFLCGKSANEPLHPLLNFALWNPLRPKSWSVSNSLGQLCHALSTFRTAILVARSETELLMLMRQILWIKIPLFQCINLFTDLLFSLMSLEAANKTIDWNHSHRKSISWLACVVFTAQGIWVFAFWPRENWGEGKYIGGRGGREGKEPGSSQLPSFFSVSPPAHLNAGELATLTMNPLLIVFNIVLQISLEDATRRRMGLRISNMMT